MFKVIVTRDALGNRILKTIRHDKPCIGIERTKTYTAEKYKDGWHIISNCPWYRTEARIADSLFTLWDKIEPFPNMTQAYKFLRQNAGRLL